MNSRIEPAPGFSVHCPVSRRANRWWVAGLVAATIGAGPPAILRAAEPDMGVRSPDAVRIQTTIRNQTGQTANDFHAQVSAKVEKGTDITGARVTQNTFPNETVNRTASNTFEFDLSGAEVPNNGVMPLDMIVWLTQQNAILFDWYWTRDGVPIGGRGGMGFRAGLPQPGGAGGNPGQQGGGGGGGNFIHGFSFYNPGDKPLSLLSLSIFASMDYYEAMDQINWGAVAPVLSSPTEVLPGQSWDYLFETTGDYVNGHLYFMASFVDDPEAQIVFGDHPVYVTPDTGGTLAILGLGVLCLFAFAQRRRLVNWLAAPKTDRGMPEAGGNEPSRGRRTE